MSRVLLKISISVLLIILVLSSTAQEMEYEPLPKAKKAFETAMLYWRSTDHSKTEKELNKAIKLDPDFPDPVIVYFTSSGDKFILFSKPQLF